MNKQKYQEKMMDAPWGPLVVHAALDLLLLTGLATYIWQVFTKSFSWEIYSGLGVFGFFSAIEFYMLYQTYKYMVKAGLGKKSFWLRLCFNMLFMIFMLVVIYFIEKR